MSNETNLLFDLDINIRVGEPRTALRRLISINKPQNIAFNLGAEETLGLLIERISIEVTRAVYYTNFVDD